MSYQKKRRLSCIVVLLFVLLAFICRFIETDNELMQTLADQCRACTYLGIYCAWVILSEQTCRTEESAPVPDCYRMSDGMLVLFAYREIPYPSGPSWRTYLLVSVLYTDDPDPNLWIIRHFTDGWSREEDNKMDHWHPLILLCGIDRLCSYQ